MKAANRGYLIIGLGVSLSAAIFLGDLLTPVDLDVWLGYIVIVAAAAWLGGSSWAYFLAALSTVLLLLVYFVAPSVTPWVSLLNRLTGLVLLWATAVLISSRRQITLLLADKAESLRKANESLQDLSHRLLEVQENERRNLSRDLHDESGQLLTAMSVKMALLRTLWERGESPVNAIEELKQMANRLAEGLHHLAVKLRPSTLDRAGLIAAVEQYMASYQQTYDIQADLVANGWDTERLAPELESSVYRIIQEALTNVARHAHAHHVGVVLTCRDDLVSAIIEDDGVGFDVEVAGRLGLSGMRERAQLLGGNLTIESGPRTGTTVYVHVPYPADPTRA